MQNVSTPRIYVDWGSWLKAIGKFKLLDTDTSLWANHGGGAEVFNNLIGLNPSSQHTFSLEGDESGFHAYYRISSGCFSADPDAYPNYLAILGHNFAKAILRVYPETCTDPYDYGEVGGIGESEIINYPSLIPDYDGFSIMKLDNPDVADNLYKGIGINFTNDIIEGGSWGDWIPYEYDVKIGSICYGRYYDFPHSPDLNLTMSVDMDGVTTQQTKGGATLSNLKYRGNPKWGELGAWELQSSPPTSWSRNAQLNARSGRRTWNLTFSYLSDKQTLPINALGSSLGDYESLIADNSGYTSGEDYYDGGDAGTIFGTQGNPLSVLNGSDFFSAVWNKTLGGHLPFIFNPQGGGTPNNNPDQFAICRFDQDSLQVTQVAYNTYTIKVKIIETW